MTQHQSNKDSLTPVAWRWRIPDGDGSERWQVVFSQSMADACRSLFDSKGLGQKVEALYALPDASQAPRSGYSQTTEVREITDLLEDLREYMDNMSDADQPSGESPRPNKEMQFLTRIEACLRNLA